MAHERKHEKTQFLPRQRCRHRFGLADVAAATSRRDGKPAATPIKVGEFASLTGKEATFGISSHEGTLLAIEEINAAGGVLGKKIELLTEDTQSKPGEPATVVNKLIARDGVVAILGEVASSRSLEAAPICQQNKIPMISPSSTNPKVTEVGDYIFRVCFIDPFQGTVMANFATKTLKAKKVAVFTDVKSDYSKGLAKFFKETFVANGGADRRPNWTTTAATRISRRSSPPSRPPIPTAFLFPATTPTRR